uniref:Conserved plasma membrane protein n=1 Tax=Caenorhabditis tropicalis TaxID=1561998 RepID=A0A1I7TR79_9PELO
MSPPPRPLPAGPNDKNRNTAQPTENNESQENQRWRIENNEMDSESSDDDRPFSPVHEIIATEPPRNPNLRNRRVSYGKIPVPPQAVTVEDIQEAAKQSRENAGAPEIRKPVDPRRSSVSLDVFKSFRDPHDKKNMPAKDKTIYVEGPNGKFREMKKGRFWDREKFESPKKVEHIQEESVIPFLLKAPGQAYRTQRIFNQVSNIVQGFLAGITVMLSIFSFNLEADVLLNGYRFMSLPIHAAFMIAFSFGLVSAIERTGIYEVEHFTSKNRLMATIYNNGLFTFIIWIVGLVFSLLCIQLESQLAFAPTKIPSARLVQYWRIFNVFRALSAALGFLLLAFRPDSDTLAKELKQFVRETGLFVMVNFRAINDHMDAVTSDPDRKRIILAAMKM